MVIKTSAGVFASSHRKIHLIKFCPRGSWTSLSWQLGRLNSALNLTPSELFVWLSSVCPMLPKPRHKLPAATQVMKDSVSPLWLLVFVPHSCWSGLNPEGRMSWTVHYPPFSRCCYLPTIAIVRHCLFLLNYCVNVLPMIENIWWNVHFHLWRPPAGPGLPTTTSTSDLATTVSSSRSS